MVNNHWLVVWNNFYFSINIGNVIVPTDELICFRGVGIPPTSHVFYGFHSKFKKWFHDPVFICIYLINKRWYSSVVGISGKLHWIKPKKSDAEVPVFRGFSCFKGQIRHRKKASHGASRGRARGLHWEPQLEHQGGTAAMLSMAAQ